MEPKMIEDLQEDSSQYTQCTRYTCFDDEGEINRLFSKKSENGTVTMPLNNYGFSKQFGWVIDQFGVSWPLNLA